MMSVMISISTLSSTKPSTYRFIIINKTKIVRDYNKPKLSITVKIKKGVIYCQSDLVIPTQVINVLITEDTFGRLFRISSVAYKLSNDLKKTAGGMNVSLSYF